MTEMIKFLFIDNFSFNFQGADLLFTTGSNIKEMK